MTNLTATVWNSSLAKLVLKKTIAKWGKCIAFLFESCVWKYKLWCTCTLKQEENQGNSFKRFWNYTQMYTRIAIQIENLICFEEKNVLMLGKIWLMWVIGQSDRYVGSATNSRITETAK